MMYYNLKLTIRNLFQNRTFSTLNILGLTLGITVVVILMAYIFNEHSYDCYHKNASNIYRINTIYDSDGKIQRIANAPNAVAPEAKAFIPEIEETARLLKNNFGDPTFINSEQNNFIEKNFFWCDESVFKIFDFTIISGNIADLSKPNKVFITKSKAKQYFGSENPIGKVVTLNGSKKIEVAGVYEDMPANSSMRIDFIGSYASTGFSSKPTTWDNASFETYALVKSNVKPETINKKLAQLIEAKIAKDDRWMSLEVQPLTDVHLNSSDIEWNYSNDLNSAATLKNITWLAIIIMLIACVNYLNLSTARLQKRMKEIGVSKTLGASFKTLFIRFITETAFLVMVAILLSIALSALLLPVFSSLINKQLSSQLLFNPTVLMGYGALWIVITLLSGFYPAYILSSYNPTGILNNRNKSRSNQLFFRKSLVTSQYVASVILIIAVIVIQQQLSFIRNKKLGFSPENVVAISSTAFKNNEAVNLLINELNKIPEVSSISRAQSFPGTSSSGRSIYKNESDENGYPLTTNHASAEIIEALKFKLIAGKTLPLLKNEKDTMVEVVINKAAADYIGLTPQDVIGKKISCQLGDNSYVVGVIDNFNFETLHQPISGYAFHNASSEPYSYVLVRYKTNDTKKLISKLETAYKKSTTQAAFDYTFLDLNLQPLYQSEERASFVTMLFSALAILIASLGLFGLSAYTTEQRTKEIGIRKVLGASVNNIVVLLSKDFMVLVIIAFVIASPLAAYLMNNWLADFSFRISIQWWMFALAGFTVICIALFTVSFQAIKAAIANPVNSIRTQ